MRPFLVLPLLAACAELAPPAASTLTERAAALRLEVGTPVPGDRVRLAVAAAPGARVVVAGGLSRGSTCTPSGCFDLRRASVLDSGTVPASGWLELAVDVPLSVAVGQTLHLQAATFGGAVSRVRTVVASEPLELAGAWDDDFGGSRDVSSFAWYDFGTFDVLRFDNAAGWALARNGADTFFPGAYSRFDWTWVGDEAFYCQSAYAAATLAEAQTAPAPDATDPASGGCGGAFAWTRLNPGVLDLEGAWLDGWGTSHTISSTTWVQDFGTWHVARFSDARRFVVAQNDASNSYHPGLWSRFDWAEHGGHTWYCQTEFGAATEAAAAYATPADATDPASGGCGGAWPGGFPWTRLDPVP